MKTPIEPDAIRPGDKVMACSNGMETTFTVDHIDTGRIYAQPGNADHASSAFLWDRDNDWYLLDRPTPPVELPTEPKLGWITQVGMPGRRLGRFSSGTPEHEFEGPIVAAERGAAGMRDINRHFRVTAFTPATAVPTEALDELRRRNAIYTGFDLVNTFLAAVDEANGGAA
jgi:hypothetical protein